MRQFGAIYPCESRASQCARFVPAPFATEEFQVHRLLRVPVRDGSEDLADFDFNAQFLPKFTPQAILEGFAGIAFAAGEFPKSAEMILRSALRD